MARLAVVDVWGSWPRSWWATAEQIEAGVVTIRGEECRITKVRTSPTCERCGAALEPNTSFDPGTGHWELCPCPSWKQRALRAEHRLAALKR